MTKPGFLPRVDGALTGYAKEDPAVAKVATRLFEDLKAVLPDGLNADWPTHPYIQVQIPDAALKRIGATPAEQQDEVARQVILAEATISESDSRAHALFGLAAFEPNLKLEALIDRWRNVYPKGSVAWMESLLEQIGHASQAKFPSFRWAAMQAVDNGQRHAPVVTRTRRLPWLKAMQFDVYLYLFSLLDATPVDSRMLRRNDMFCKTMAAGGEAGVRVRDLTRELKARGYNRVPFVTADDRFVYIVHRSMLDRYLVEQMDSDADIGTLTLADLYQAQPEVKEMFVKTAAFIGTDGHPRHHEGADEGHAELLRRVRHAERRPRRTDPRLDHRPDCRGQRAADATPDPALRLCQLGADRGQRRIHVGFGVEDVRREADAVEPLLLDHLHHHAMPVAEPVAQDVARILIRDAGGDEARAQRSRRRAGHRQLRDGLQAGIGAWRRSRMRRSMAAAPRACAASIATPRPAISGRLPMPVECATTRRPSSRCTGWMRSSASLLM